MTRPLTQEDVGKLKAGRSVLLWNDTMLADLVSHQDDGKLAVSVGPLMDDFFAAPTESFKYVGERDEDGWIHAPEGGWSENPVPGMKFGGSQPRGLSPLSHPTNPMASENYDWPNMEAFRPIDRPEREAEAVTRSLADRLISYRPTNEWGDPVHHMICDEAAKAITDLEERLSVMRGALADLVSAVAYRQMESGRRSYGLTGRFPAAYQAAAQAISTTPGKSDV